MHARDGHDHDEGPALDRRSPILQLLLVTGTAGIWFLAAYPRQLEQLHAYQRARSSNTEMHLEPRRELARVAGVVLLALWGPPLLGALPGVVPESRAAAPIIFGCFTAIAWASYCFSVHRKLDWTLRMADVPERDLLGRWRFGIATVLLGGGLVAIVQHGINRIADAVPPPTSVSDTGTVGRGTPDFLVGAVAAAAARPSLPPPAPVRAVAVRDLHAEARSILAELGKDSMLGRLGPADRERYAWGIEQLYGAEAAARWRQESSGGPDERAS